MFTLAQTAWHINFFFSSFIHIYPSTQHSNTWQTAVCTAVNILIVSSIVLILPCIPLALYLHHINLNFLSLTCPFHYVTALCAFSCPSGTNKVFSMQLTFSHPYVSVNKSCILNSIAEVYTAGFHVCFFSVLVNSSLYGFCSLCVLAVWTLRMKRRCWNPKGFILNPTLS